MSTGLQLDINLEQSARGRPKYEALKDYFVGELRSGRLEPGAALPTEQALAVAAGVARSTVRQAMGALERDGLIRRVQGKGTFVHDAAKQRLRSGMELLALIVPETRSGFYPSLLHGFEAASRENQHQAVVCNTENNVDRQGSTILQLIDKQVAGVSIVPATHPSTPAYQIRQLHEHQIPVVFCHRPVPGMPAPLLALPYEKIGRLAGEKFLANGHRRIAFMGSHFSESMTRYGQGLSAALREAGCPMRDNDVWCGHSISYDSLEQEVLTALDGILSHADPPTAIFVSFDSVAEVIYFALTQTLGLRVPEDISLISVGGTWRESVMTRRLTSVVVDEVSAANRAVQLLAEMRGGSRPLTDDEVFELPLDVSDGQTLGPVSK